MGRVNGRSRKKGKKRTVQNFFPINSYFLKLPCRHVGTNKHENFLSCRSSQSSISIEAANETMWKKVDAYWWYKPRSWNWHEPVIRTKQCCLKSTQGKFLNPDWLLHMVKRKGGIYVAMVWGRSIFRGNKQGSDRVQNRRLQRAIVNAETKKAGSKWRADSLTCWWK